MEFSNLLEIAENQIFIVGDDFWWFGIFYSFYVMVNDTRKITPEFFFRFD